MVAHNIKDTHYYLVLMSYNVEKKDWRTGMEEIPSIFWHHSFGRVLHIFVQEKEWTIFVKGDLQEILSIFFTGTYLWVSRSKPSENNNKF